MNVLSTLFRKFGRRQTAALERRLTRRALLYWQSIEREGGLVPVGAFDPQALEDYASHGFMLDLRDMGRPLLCHIGPVLRQEADVTGLPVALADVPERSLLGQFGRRWEGVLSQQQPMTADYDFKTDSYHILCRGALLPLSSDGRSIDHVYGVISWKSVKLPVAEA